MSWNCAGVCNTSASWAYFRKHEVSWGDMFLNPDTSAAAQPQVCGVSTHSLKTTRWMAPVYALGLWPCVYDTLIVSAQPLKAITHQNKGAGKRDTDILHLKEDAGCNSFDSSSQHEGAHDTSSRSKKTVVSVCNLKRKRLFFFFMCKERG